MLPVTVTLAGLRDRDGSRFSACHSDLAKSHFRETSDDRRGDLVMIQVLPADPRARAGAGGGREREHREAATVRANRAGFIEELLECRSFKSI